jgi:hypothetical protein
MPPFGMSPLPWLALIPPTFPYRVAAPALDALLWFGGNKRAACGMDRSVSPANPPARRGLRLIGPRG